MAEESVETTRVDAVVTQFRQYDQAVKDWILSSAPTKQDAKTVPVIFSTPDRAFSSMQEILQEQQGVQVDIKNIPLPFVSISRSSVLYDPTRFHGPNVGFRAMAASPETPANTYYQANFPLPYDITYQVEVWTKNRETLNAYELWTKLQFKNGFETFLNVKLSEVWDAWGDKLVPFEDEGIQDVSDLEPQDGHRVLRFTQRLTGKAWLLGEITTVKAVHEILQDYYITEDRTVNLQTVTAEQVESDPETFDLVLRVLTKAS